MVNVAATVLANQAAALRRVYAPYYQGGATGGLFVAALAHAGAGRSGGRLVSATRRRARAPVCPKSSRASWQRLANEIKAPVYCPSLLPQPLGGKFGARFLNGRFVVSADGTLHPKGTIVPRRGAFNTLDNPFFLTTHEGRDT